MEKHNESPEVLERVARLETSMEHIAHSVDRLATKLDSFKVPWIGIASIMALLCGALIWVITTMNAPLVNAVANNTKQIEKLEKTIQSHHHDH